MSEEIKSIEGVKVSDVFDFTKVGFPVSWSDKQIRICGRALRNHDSMQDQITQLEKDKAELVGYLRGLVTPLEVKQGLTKYEAQCMADGIRNWLERDE